MAACVAELAESSPADAPTASWSWADAPNLDLLQTAIDRLNPAAAARPVRQRTSLSLLVVAGAAYNENICAIAAAFGEAPDPRELLPTPTIVELHRLRTEMRSHRVDAWGRQHAPMDHHAGLHGKPATRVIVPRRVRRASCGRERRPGARRRTRTGARAGPSSEEPAPADGRSVPEDLIAGPAR